MSIPRVAIAVFTAFALAVVPTAVYAASASWDEVVVLDADDPVGAAVAWSRATFDDGTVARVFLARADVFADSLASGGAQQSATPLLLTGPDELDPRTADELARLDPDQVVVVGGDEAVSDPVVDELEGFGYEAPRVDGTTRTDTAVGLAGLLPDAERAVVVRGYGDDSTGSSWADSLAAGGWAASQGAPVLLTDGSGLPSVVADHLEGSAVEEVVVVGGVDAVPDAVLDDVAALGLTARRVAGADRYSTAVAVATDLWGIDGAADTDRTVLVEATAGDAWASGFAAASHAGVFSAPVLLSDPDGGLTDPVTGWVGDGNPSGTLVCGPGVAGGVCAPPPAPEPSPSPEPEPTPSPEPDPEPSPEPDPERASVTVFGREDTTAGVQPDATWGFAWSMACDDGTDVEGITTVPAGRGSGTSSRAEPAEVRFGAECVVTATLPGGAESIVNNGDGDRRGPVAEFVVEREFDGVGFDLAFDDQPSAPRPGVTGVGAAPRPGDAQAQGTWAVECDDGTSESGTLDPRLTPLVEVDEGVECEVTTDGDAVESRLIGVGADEDPSERLARTVTVSVYPTWVEYAAAG